MSNALPNNRKIFQVSALSGLALLVSACGGGNNDPAEGGQLANPPAPTTASYELVWSDEFDGDSLNTANWEAQLGDGTAEGIPGWGNNELQVYTADEENVSVSEGTLKIVARANDPNDLSQGFTSARLRTQGNVDFTYGRVEASIKLPAGAGLWPAFWMLSSEETNPYGAWPASGEIDIMEWLQGVSSTTSSAIHFGSTGNSAGRKFIDKFSDVTPGDQFHQFAVEWDAEQIRFFIDGDHYFTIRDESWYNYYFKNAQEGFVRGEGNAPFDVDFHLLLNLAVGGLGGQPAAGSFPATMEVDYVRLYQCPLNPETGIGCEGSIDEPNYYVIADVPPMEPVISEYTLYEDGAGLLFPDTGVDRPLALNVFDNEGAFTLAEVDGGEGNTVLDLTTSGGGNVSIVAADEGRFGFVNMGTASAPLSAADFKFRLRVVDDGMTADDAMLQVRFDSGFPDVGFVELPLSNYTPGEWVDVAVRVTDMIQGGQGAFGGAPVDTSQIASLITFEPTAAAHVQIDNVRLGCGGPEFCGIQQKASQPLAIFADAVDGRFERGIQGFDTVVGDYSDGAAGNHYQWAVIDTMEEGYDSVIQTTVSDSGASGVTFIGTAEPVDITAWQEGELAFNVRVLSNPNDHPMIYKVDGIDGAGTGDQSLGVLPLNEWVDVRVPVTSLQEKGLVLTDMTAFVLFPTFAGQDVVYQWDNIRIEPTVTVQAVPITVPVDFEETPISYNLTNFEGGAAGVVANPDTDGNSSANVLQLQKFAGATFAGSVLNLSEAVDFSAGEVFSAKVWSSRVTALTFKLEGLNIEQVVNTSGTGWETLTFDFSGQTGGTDVLGLTFIMDNGTAGDAANAPNDWTMYIDDITLEASAPQALSFSNDFENQDAGASTVAGFLSFGAVFNSSGDFLYNYGAPFDTPNGTGNIAGIASGEGGAEQGSQYLNLFSDYNNGDHANGNTIEITTFREFTINAEDTGEFVFTFDVKLPSTGGLEAPSTAVAFIKVLDPANGFAQTAYAETDISDASATDWQTRSVTITLDGAALEGQILQVGFISRATNYDPSAFLVDNMQFELAPEVASQIEFSNDFESADSSAATIPGFTTFVNVFNPDDSYAYGYGTFDTPNGTGNIAAIASGEAGMDQGVQYLNAFSDYANADHGNGLKINVLTFREFTIASTDGGDYQFSFDAKLPDMNGLASPSIAFAFIKVLDPNNGFATTIDIELPLDSLSSDDWQTLTMDVSLDGAALAGQILQVGFANTATNYDPSGVYYDNLSFAIATPSEEPEVTEVAYASDFESNDAAAATIGDGWLTYVEVQDAGGAFLYNYGAPFASPNNTGNIAQIASGEAGAEQGTQYLNHFSDYGNADHGNGHDIVVSTFQERTLTADNAGNYTFSVDVKAPASGGIANGSYAEIFIKVLDPNNGFATTVYELTDVTAVSTSDWTTYTLSTEITDAMAGQILQWGFTNRATNYEPSGVYYDNVSFGFSE